MYFESYYRGIFSLETMNKCICSFSGELATEKIGNLWFMTFNFWLLATVGFSIGKWILRSETKLLLWWKRQDIDKQSCFRSVSLSMKYSLFINFLYPNSIIDTRTPLGLSLLVENLSHFCFTKSIYTPMFNQLFTVSEFQIQSLVALRGIRHLFESL